METNSLIQLRPTRTTHASRAPKGVPCKFTTGPVVLVSMPVEYTFPLSYGYLAGYLIEREEKVQMLFRSTDPRETARRIMLTNPVCVGFGSLYPELQEIREIIAELDRAGRQFPVIVGGQMVTPTPEFAVDVTGADFGVIGEGEVVLYQLVRALREGRDPTLVKGLAIRRPGSTFVTGHGEVIDDLSALPRVPYDMLPVDRWLNIGLWYAENCPQPHWKVRDRVVNIHGGRGCPFTCNFCYHHSQSRYRPVQQMMDEGMESMDRFNANLLYFSDDLVIASPARARQVLDYVKKLNRPVEFSWSTRFDILMRIEDSLLQEMKDAGCRILGLGIESGSDRILEIIGKKYRGDDVLRELARLKKVGILPTVSIMVGQHTENKEDVEQSARIVRESLRADPSINYSFTIMTPFPGSPLYNTVLQQGLVRDHQHFYDLYFGTKASVDFKLVVNMSAMTDAEVLASHAKLVQTYAEERPKTLYKRTVRTLTNDLEKHRRAFGHAPHVDKIWFTESRDLVFRFVSEVPEGVSVPEEELDNYLDSVPIAPEYVSVLMDVALQQFPEAAAQFQGKALTLEPFESGLPHRERWGSRCLRWYAVRARPASERTSDVGRAAFH